MSTTGKVPNKCVRLAESERRNIEQAGNEVRSRDDRRGKVNSSIAALAVLSCGVATLGSSPAAEAQGAGDAVTAASLPQDPANRSSWASSCRQLDQAVGIRSWVVRSPSSCDTILGDSWGIRSSLASAGIGISLYSINNFSSNVMNNDTAQPKTQAFGGQKPTLSSLTNLYITYNLGALGDADGQLVVGGTATRNTWVSLGPSGNSLNSAYWYQSLFNKKLEFKIGYMAMALEYIGAQLGGTLAGGANGISASIQYSQGLTSPALSSPSASFTYNISKDFYDRFGITRSTDPGGATPNFTYNRTSTRFEVPNREMGAIVINEFGYRHRPDENSSLTWVRAGYFHNDSGFASYSNPGTTSHSSVEYILADHQFLKLSSAHTDPNTPGRGYYIGGTFMNADCDLTLFCKYGEVRLYGIGIIPNRPADIVSIIGNHSMFSGAAEAARHIVAPHVAQNALTLAYLAHITPGWYINGGLGFTEHPAFGSSITTPTSNSYSSALNFLLGTSLFF
ncbi:MAG: hypothetical protein JWR07_1254 [Nevskia sp.]|nr:hypothetical protein [Nevskia sp.]